MHDSLSIDGNFLYLGDCLEELRRLDESSIDAMVTDPPAGINFMSKKWDKSDGFIPFMTGVMSEALRVLKPGAHAFVWAIPRTSHWTATALENAGFEIRDVVTHIFGSGFPKSLDISKAIDKAAGAEREIVGKKPYTNQDTRGNPISETGGRGTGLGQDKPRLALDITTAATDAAKQWQGFGTALKPASEHWILVRKPISEKTVAANVLKHGTGGLNIDASRISVDPSDPNHRKSTGGYVKTESEATTQNAPYNKTRDATLTQGRFPANLVLSHSEDCVGEFGLDGYEHPAECTPGCAVAMLDEQSGVSGSNARKRRGQYSGGTFAGGLKQDSTEHDDSGGASRFFANFNYTEGEKHARKNECIAQYVNKLLRDKTDLIVLGNALELLLHDQEGNHHQSNILVDIAIKNSWTTLETELKERILSALENVALCLDLVGHYLNVLCAEQNVINIEINSVLEVVKTNYNIAHLLLLTLDCTEGTNDSMQDQKNVPIVQNKASIDTTKIIQSHLILSGYVQAAIKSGIISEKEHLKKESGQLRFKYQSKASKRERNEGCEGLPLVKAGIGDERPSGQSMQRLDGRDSRESQNHHPTVKPLKLMRYLITMITPPGGTVLDCFMGSGSTGVAAVQSGFKFIGIEKEEEYFKIAEKRIFHKFPEMKKEYHK